MASEKETIYLDSDDEITGVIERIKDSENSCVILVVPKGGTLTQSIVNLKLLLRTVREIKKHILIVAGDRITKNLAGQLGIPVFHKVADAKAARMMTVKKTEGPDLEQEERDTLEPGSYQLGGLTVNTYKKYDPDVEPDEEPKNEITEESEEKEIDAENPEELTLEEEDISEEDHLGQDSKSDYEADQSAIAVEDNEEDEPKIHHQNRPVSEYRDEEEAEEEGSRKFSYDDRETERVELPRRDSYSAQKHIRTGGRRRFLISIFSIIALIVLAALYVALPKAKVTLTLATEDYNKNLEILVDRNLKSPDSAGLSLPGELASVEKEGTKDFASTGKKNVGEKATGKVTVSNYYDYQKNISIEKGAVVTSGDKKFVVTKAVLVPTATATLAIENNIPVVKTNPGQAETDVEAVDPGDQLNLAPGKLLFSSFSGEKKDKVYAENKAAFSGGTTKEVKFVTEEDLTKAETAMKSEALPGAKTELAENAAKAGLKIFNDCFSTEVISFEVNKKVNDEADAFQAKMKAKSFVLGFKEQDLMTVVKEGITSKLENNKMFVDFKATDLTYDKAVCDIDAGSIKINLALNSKIGDKIVAEDIKNSIKNKSLSSANSYLAGIIGVKSSTLAIWPSFIPRTPLLKQKIEVQFSYEK